MFDPVRQPFTRRIDENSFIDLLTYNSLETKEEGA